MNIRIGRNTHESIGIRGLRCDIRAGYAIGVNLRLKCLPNLAFTSCVGPLNPPILGDFEELDSIVKPLKIQGD
jgi:hypothetical protein